MLYLSDPPDDDLEQQLVAAGGRRVPLRNPYWDQWGLTIVGPDGYRLVLSSRTWAWTTHAAQRQPEPAGML